jgi:hypothetical protein
MVPDAPAWRPNPIQSRYSIESFSVVITLEDYKDFVIAMAQLRSLRHVEIDEQKSGNYAVA